ncbi:MAG: glycosyltransferase family 2 protein [Nitrospirae bacterium]|nr:glycosyltransferase family 2 protein [Nitrospirota bacterium]MBF0540501.1 glycosyltransferase family 2 protein [Nitrospirota bacterium]
MKLTIVIPCYNEIKTIDEILNQVKAFPYPDKEIILVDDCSTDGTKERLRDVIATNVDKVLFHQQNMGKGASLRTGISAATGDIVIIQDADFEYDPFEIPLVIQPIIDNKADIVYGSRFMNGSTHKVVNFWHMLGNKFLTILSNMFSNMYLTDMETCYKAFRREIIQSITIEENRFGFEPEITAKVSKLRCRIYEVGISYSGRTYEQGKKINWKDGFRAIWCILKYNLLK